MLRSAVKIGFIVILPLLFVSHNLAAQTVVKGKVKDASTGDPIPFAGVFFTGTPIGTTTDFEGNYIIKTTSKVDSLTVSYIGYAARIKAITPNKEQIIDFQLDESVMNLNELVFYAGENPAHEILRRVVKNKKNNDKRQLEAFQYESYNKIEIDVDNISEKMRKRKIMQKIITVMDSVEQMAGEDGKPVLPVFISESLSEFYYRSSPRLLHEKILKTKITGVGVEDGTLVSQLIGSSFQNYNFYENWLNIVEKEFVSPIADGWKLYYEYDLSDSGYVDDEYCYKLDFFPKRDQDLAFNGTMWITKDDYALKQIDASVLPIANLNFIERIKIQQELAPTAAGQWLPLKTRILLDIGQIRDNMAGMLVKFYSSNDNIVVNKPLDENFYRLPIEIAQDVSLNSDDQYWDKHRHEPLTEQEKTVYQMIDTLRSIPVVKTYTELIKIAVNGYAKAGKFDVGPYLSVYAYNEIEGHRFQLGGRTNIKFSDQWILGGYLAYGTKDEKYKYNGFVRFIADKEQWTTFSLGYANDIDQVGLEVENIADNQFFLAATRFGSLTKPYRFESYKFTMSRDIFKGFRQTLSIKNSSFDPLFNFAYRSKPDVDLSPLETNYKTTEITVESRYAKDEVVVINDNNRMSLGTINWPVIKVSYTAGIEDILGSDFTYHKVNLTLRDNIVMGFLGTSDVVLAGEKIFGALPYPLLETHVGNESFFYTSAAFNLMNFSEFASDQYVSLKYFHHFQGFILNRIPLMKKLQWRLLASGSMVYGTLSQKNRDLIPDFTSDGEPIQQLSSLGDKPYVEVGYGIENIFKFGRIDFLHRLTHLDKPDVNSFGVKISFQFLL